MLKLLISIKMKAMFEGMFASSKTKGGKSSKKEKSGKGKMASYMFLIIFLVVIVGGLFATIFWQIGRPFIALGLGWLYFAMMGIFVFLLCFVGSVFVTQTQIYESKDNELLLSMPVKPSMILASRMISLLLLNYAYEMIIALPAGIVYGALGGFTAGGVVAYILCILLLPLLAVTVSSLFGWIVAAISSKMKSKRIVSMALSLILFGLYMYVCMQWQMYVQKLIENGQAVAEAIQGTLPPFYHMGVAISDGNIISMLIFALWTILPFALIYLFVSRSFIKIATAKRGGAKIEYRKKAMKESGVKKALLVNEMRRLGSSNMYMFNAAIGLAFMVGISVYLAIKSGDFAPVIAMIDPTHMMTAAMGCLLIMAMASLTIISAPTISLEAKTLWILKSLPLAGRDVLWAKAMMHIVISLPFVLVSAIILAVTYEMNIVGIALMILVPCAFVALTGIAGVIINLKYPKFNWINESAAVKQGLAPTVAILVSMALVVIPVLLYFFVIKDTGLNMEIYMTLVLVIFAVLTVVAYRYLMTVGVRKFEKLQSE